MREVPVRWSSSLLLYSGPQALFSSGVFSVVQVALIRHQLLDLPGYYCRFHSYHHFTSFPPQAVGCLCSEVYDCT